jgi:hypothetical protein
MTRHRLKNPHDVISFSAARFRWRLAGYSLSFCSDFFGAGFLERARGLRLASWRFASLLFAALLGET